MSTNELALETIRALPEDVSWQDIEERVRFIAAVEKGREAAGKGEVVPHEDVSELLRSRTIK